MKGVYTSLSPLLLSPRKGSTPLPDHSLVALRELSDEVVGVGSPRHRLNLLLACSWVPVPDIGGDTGGEQDRLL